MEIAVIPLLVVVVASIFQGSFGLGMKFMAPLKWESWWLVHSVVAMLLFPMAWAFCVVPDLLGIITQASFATIGMAMFFGFLWGIGGVVVMLIGVAFTAYAGILRDKSKAASETKIQLKAGLS